MANILTTDRASQMDKRMDMVSTSGVLLLRKELDVHVSVHHNINLIQITNKMRPCNRIYYSSVS